MVISTGKKALALRLRKTTSLSTRVIASQVNAADSTVQRWLKGIPSGGKSSQGEARQATLRQASSPASNDSLRQSEVRQGEVTHLLSVQGKARRVKASQSVKTGQKSISNNGGYIVVYFVVVLLIVFLLDHFLFEGRLLKYIRSYCYTEEKETEIPLEKVPESQGFLGRSEEDL
ncbi:unnamed protein product [marine sediment metagenome]|uniref:Uncharacterized protein n=1 Tax=marine sediment metagenome TaxID=412755 RepID=X1R603_9ZZZZ